MRIALVSPYSWTYQGGVNRHVEALAEQFIARGDHVRVLAPWDPPDVISRRLHRSQPELREAPDYLIPLGRTVGVGAERRRLQPLGLPARARSRCAASCAPGDYDVVHVHEPLAPMVGWDAMLFRGAPVVGTFHAYSTKAFPNHVATLLGRAPPVQPALARGSRSPRPPPGPGGAGSAATTRSSPTASTSRPRRRGPKPPSEELRLLFVGRAEERKGLPVLLAAFAGAGRARPLPADRRRRGSRGVSRAASPIQTCMSHIDVLGKVSDAVLWRQLARGRRALRALARRRELRHGPDRGVRRRHAGGRVGDRRLQRCRHRRRRRRSGAARRPAGAGRGAPAARARARAAAWRWARRGRRSAERYAWPRIAERGRPRSTSGRSEPVPRRSRECESAATDRVVRLDGGPQSPGASAFPRSSPPRCAAGRGAPRRPQGSALGVAGVLGLGLTALAARRIGVDQRGRQHHRLGPRVGADRAAPCWSASMFAARRLLGRDRPGRASRPARESPRRTSATMIGVLMSATLPARLGEPARAMVLSRRRRPDARDLPGAGRHAGLADRPQHPRAGAARRDHGLHHRPLPGEHPEALPGLDRPAADPAGGAAWRRRWSR